MGRPVTWTRARIAAAIRDFAARNGGRAPTSAEFWRGKVGPTIDAMRREFGSTRKAVLAAGVPPRKPGGCLKNGRTRPRHSVKLELPPIDPVKAERITAELTEFWTAGQRPRRPRLPVHSHEPQHLLERTDGNGNAFLECWCGYREPVVRKPDPSPSTIRHYVFSDGVRRTRFVGGTGETRKGMQKRRSA